MNALGGICAIALLTIGLLGAPARAQTTTDPSQPSAVDPVQTQQLESLLGREVRTRAEGDRSTVARVYASGSVR